MSCCTYQKDQNVAVGISRDALELDKRLKDLRDKDKWKEDEMEECEDFDGNIMNKKTFQDLRAQGLI